MFSRSLWFLFVVCAGIVLMISRNFSPILALDPFVQNIILIAYPPANPGINFSKLIPGGPKALSFGPTVRSTQKFQRNVFFFLNTWSIFCSSFFWKVNVPLINLANVPTIRVCQGDTIVFLNNGQRVYMLEGDDGLKNFHSGLVYPYVSGFRLRLKTFYKYSVFAQPGNYTYRDVRSGQTGRIEVFPNRARDPYVTSSPFPHTTFVFIWDLHFLSSFYTSFHNVN